ALGGHMLRLRPLPRAPRHARRRLYAPEEPRARRREPARGTRPRLARRLGDRAHADAPRRRGPPPEELPAPRLRRARVPRGERAHVRPVALDAPSERRRASGVLRRAPPAPRGAPGRPLRRRRPRLAADRLRLLLELHRRRRAG